MATWLAFLVSLVVYAGGGLGGIWITPIILGAVVSGTMVVLWVVVVIRALVGTLRSARAALRQWGRHKGQAVGAVVTVAGLACPLCRAHRHDVDLSAPRL